MYKEFQVISHDHIITILYDAIQVSDTLCNKMIYCKLITIANS